MPWSKGECGNPKGRPRKGKTLTDILEKYGRKRDVELDDGKKYRRKDVLATKVWEMALNGDFPAIKFIWERIEGLPKQQLEHTGKEGEAIEITFVNHFDGV